MIPFSGLPPVYPRAHEAREAPGGGVFVRKDFFAKMPALILFQSTFLLVFFWLSMILINSDNRKAKGSR